MTKEVSLLHDVLFWAFSKKTKQTAFTARVEEETEMCFVFFYCVSAWWKLSICAFFLFRIYNVKNHKFAKFTTSSVIDCGDDRGGKTQPATDVKRTRGGSFELLPVN